MKQERKTIHGLPVVGYRVEVRVIPLASLQSPHPAFRPPEGSIDEFRGSAGLDCIITSEAVAGVDQGKIGEYLADAARRAWEDMKKREPEWPWDAAEAPPV